MESKSNHTCCILFFFFVFFFLSLFPKDKRRRWSALLLFKKKICLSSWIARVTLIICHHQQQSHQKKKKKNHKKKSCCSDLLSPTRLCILFELCGNEQLHRSWGVESLLPIPSSQPPSRAMTFKVKYWHGSPLSAWQQYNFPCGFGRIRHHGGVT